MPRLLRLDDMSETTGDKARFGRQRKRNIAKRESGRALRKQLMAQKEPEGQPKKAAVSKESAPA